MANNKRSTNPLLGPAVSGFSLSQSFGAQAAVLVPSTSASPAPYSLSPAPGPFTSSPADASSLGPPSSSQFRSPGLSPMGPPVLKPPPAGVFLLPTQSGARLTPSPGLSTSQNLGPPPPPASSPFLAGNLASVQTAKRSPYVPPPGNYTCKTFCF